MQKIKVMTKHFKGNNNAEKLLNFRRFFSRPKKGTDSNTVHALSLPFWSNHKSANRSQPSLLIDIQI